MEQLTAIVQFEAEALPPAELEATAARLATGLRSLGVAAGDRVVIAMSNSPEALITDRAVKLLGATPVAANWHASTDELAHIIRDSTARVVVAHDTVVRFDRLEVPLVLHHRHGRDAAQASGAVDWDRLIENAPLQTAVDGNSETVIYTSGTTGKPKGVLRSTTPEQRFKSAAMRRLLYGGGEGARLLTSAPLYHSAPLNMCKHVLERGELIVLESKFNAERTLQLIEQNRITHLFAVPTMFSRILQLPDEVHNKYDVSSLQFVLHAGAPCPRDIKRKMIDLWGPVIYEYYGSTENGPISFSNSADWQNRPGTVGRVIAGVRIALLDPVTGGPDGEPPAEIAVDSRDFGDFTYLNAAEARAELQQGEFVATGDVGYLDSDGYLYVTDRLRDLVISGGVNLYPAEIEAVIRQVPCVQDVVVVGVPDEDLGEVLLAVVESQDEPNEVADAVREYTEQALGRLKRPKHIVVETAIRREENGKVKKRVLRDIYLATLGDAK